MGDNLSDVSQDLQVVKMRLKSRIPIRTSGGACGFDMFVGEDVLIDAGRVGVVPLGVKIRVPQGTYGILIYCYFRF